LAYHPPLLVEIHEGCKVVIIDTAADEGEDPEAWESRPIQFCNKSDMKATVTFDSGDFITGGDSITLPPGECATRRFRSTVDDDTEEVTFDVWCISGVYGKTTSEGHLSWKFPPPDPTEGTGP
jgi:hypothetical protein